MLRRIAHGRFKQLNYGRVIKVLERRPLSAKSILYLIQVGEKKILVSESQLEVRALTAVEVVSTGENILKIFQQHCDKEYLPDLIFHQR